LFGKLNITDRLLSKLTKKNSNKLEDLEEMDEFLDAYEN
jgi:hypothetical protein